MIIRSKNIIDIIEEVNSITYYIYKWLENPRKLVIKFNE